jgi:DNA-binding transcriptional regulator YhcF (GntR family)
MDREDPSDPAADDTEIPAGWATVRALAVQRGVSMGTVRRHYGEYKSIPFRRLADGRIIVNAAAIPKDHFKRTHRHREMMDDVRREIEQAASDSSYSAEEYSAVQVIRRHVRWLEQTVEELQGRHAEYERERRRMEQAHRAERQQLLGIVASLTGAAPTPDAEPALRPRRPRRKAPEVG